MSELSRRRFLQLSGGGAALLAAYLAGLHDGKSAPSKDSITNAELLQVRETLKAYFQQDFLGSISPDNLFGGDLLSALDKTSFPGNLKVHPLIYDAVVETENPGLNDAYRPDKHPNGQIAIYLSDDEKKGRMEFKVLSPTQKPPLEMLPSLAESVFKLPPDLEWKTYLESEYGDTLGLKADIAVALFTQGGLQYRASANVDGSLYMDFMPEPPAVRIQVGQF